MEGFVPFPKKLLRTLKSVFGCTEQMENLAAVLAVVDFKRSNQTREPSISYLSFISGLSEAELTAAFQRLENQGLIEWSNDDDRDECIVDHRKLLKVIEIEAINNR